MESFIAVITSLSNIIGVPASLCLAWAAFIIRDQGKRITTLEADMKEMEGKFTVALKEMEDKFTVALKEMDSRRDDELSKLYDKINGIAQDVSYIKGRIDKEDAK